MKVKIIGALCLSFLVLFTVTAILPVNGEAEIYDDMIRLHVLANSDSEEDQALKLKVRDAILSYVSPRVIDSQTRQEAAQILQSELGAIKELAKEVILKEGFDYEVDVTLTFEDYPTRNYESMSFPSGEYMSLRVLIGEAEGQNWWCVLFPPLCLSAASEKSDNEDAFIAVGLNSDQYKIITESKESKYYLRFKILEAIESIGK